MLFLNSMEVKKDLTLYMVNTCRSFLDPDVASIGGSKAQRSFAVRRKA